MFSFSTFIYALAALSLASECAAVKSRRIESRRSRLIPRKAAPSRYELVTKHQGETFINDWSFFTHPDPTHGTVNYVNAETAKKEGLYKVVNNTVVISVDDKTVLPNGAKRKSVRLTSNKSYNHGLFIFDASRMPTGCSVWGAWWTVGPDWPRGGEIDVVEGVNNGDHNQATFHTSPGCEVDSSKPNATTSKLGKTSCASGAGDNGGCPFFDTHASGFGKAFNEGGGGVYAHTLGPEGIDIYFFPRRGGRGIPSDITSGKPDPSSWGKPIARLSPDKCKIGDHFYDHSLVINTTLCGDWAGNAYKSSGCPGSCAEAVMDPKNFEDAKWVINSISVYQIAGG